MKRITFQRILAGGIAAFALCAGSAGAQTNQTDALLNKLVEKGILTTAEAKSLQQDADQNINKAFQAKSGMPDWVTSMKFGGDFRGRYEGFFSENPEFVDRNRFRYRLRLGAVVTLKDDFEIGVRLTSGDPVAGFGTQTGSPLSGNTTLQDNGSKKSVFVDLAYAKWRPLHNSSANLAITFGKMESPFSFSPNVFDNDYNPEGLAAQFTYHLSSQHDVRLIAGGFVLDEISVNTRDPFLLGAQVLFDSTWSKHLSTSLGGGILAITGVTNLVNNAVPNVNRGNTRDPLITSPSTYFNPIVADASLTYTLESFPGYKGAFPVKVLGEYLHNPATPTKNQAALAGVVFGKAGKKGQWELNYQYRYLAANSWYEELPEDDFGAYYQAELPNSGFINPTTNPLGAGYGGGTNVRGHVAKVSYSVTDALTLSFTYYLTLLVNENPAGSKSGATHVLVDMNWKF